MAVRPGEFDVAIQDGVLLIRVHKAELKSAEAEYLIEVVFDDPGVDCEQVLINLEEVDYINSTVMSALSRISVARELRLVALSYGVERILDTMGLLQFLDRCKTEADALADFSRDAG